MSAENIGRYEIVQELGKGAMGVVYKALDPTIGRTLALKTMRLDVHGMEAEEMLKRFRNEARAAGTLNHPNIVTIYDAGEWQGLFYIAMEFIEGLTLHQRMKQGRLTTEEIVDITAQSCAGLDYAHAKGVIHRDVKPANIMLAGPLVKLMDFGIAKSGGATMTGTGQVLGTPNYMAPEQVRGKPLDGRSDLFSMGVILYEMVTGERPFTGENVTTIVYKIVHENPIAPKDLDATVHPSLSAVVLKSLEKAPDLRFQSGAEMAHALNSYKTAGESTGPTGVMDAPLAGEATGSSAASASASIPASTAAMLRAAEAAAAAASGHHPPPSTGTKASATPAAQAAAAAPAAMPAAVRAPVAAVRPAAAPRASSATPLPKPIPKGGKPGPPLPVVAGIAVLALAMLAGAYWKLQHRSQPFPAQAERQPAQQAQAPATSPPSQDAAEPAPGKAVTQEQQPVAADSTVSTEPASEPKAGELLVSSQPAGALITMDARHDAKWITPFTFSGLKPGPHRLTITLEGYDPQIRSVQVAAAGRVSSAFTLVANAGYVAVSSEPSGAAITVDNKATGQVTPARILLSPGPHHVALQMDGYRPESALVDIGAGQTLPLSPKLTRVVQQAQATPAQQPAAAPSKPAAAAPANAVPFDAPQTVGGNPFGKMKRMFAGIPEGRGMIEIRTKPKGAEVTVNNRFEVPMKTPLRLPTRPGSYTLTLRLKGYKTLSQKVEVTEGKGSSVDVQLEKEK